MDLTRSLPELRTAAEAAHLRSAARSRVGRLAWPRVSEPAATSRARRAAVWLRVRWLAALWLLLCGSPLWAHVGSPDVYVETKAGAYPIFVTVRPPLVLPGVAEVSVRAEGSGVQEVTAAPTPLTGDAAMHAPTPDVLRREADGSYTGSLWIMATGSWQVRFHVRGAAGAGDVAIPLPSTSTSVRTMSPWMGAGLALVGLMLLVGMAGIAGAGVREAVLPPGTVADDARRWRGKRATALTLVLLVAAVALGDRWWNVEAAAYGRSVYKPLRLTATLREDGGLTLQLRDPGWLPQRRLDDLVPDHGHLVHLYAVRWPAMDAVYHLHPEMTSTGTFLLRSPAVAPGYYRLFADVVHRNGFPETAVAGITLSGQPASALQGDDAGSASLPRLAAPGANALQLTMPDGYRVQFDRPARVAAREGLLLHFRLLDSQGHAPTDMTPYMGMPGHAAILKSDGSVFAHIHPEGSISMAAYMMANPEMMMDASSAPAAAGDLAEAPVKAAISNEVAFPYGFPSAGRYRVIVQVKHGATVETAAFDVDVV